VVLVAVLAAVLSVMLARTLLEPGPTLSTPVPPPTLTPGIATREIVVALPTATIAPTRTVVPTATVAPTGTPTATEEWLVLQPQLDTAWASDWPRTIDLLHVYLSRFPEFRPAREKLFAALNAYADDLFGNGKPSDGLVQLEQAQLYAPDRPGSAPPDAAEVWQAFLPRLDTTWDSDWVTTEDRLIAFVQRYPDFTDARAKLYEAYVSRARGLVEQGNVDEAVSQLDKAQSLLPDRGEAAEVSRLLTPTPEPQAGVVQPSALLDGNQLQLSQPPTGAHSSRSTLRGTDRSV